MPALTLHFIVKSVWYRRALDAESSRPRLSSFHKSQVIERRQKTFWRHQWDALAHHAKHTPVPHPTNPAGQRLI
ncbi:hypothetical protein AGOR_G00133880 [Albula goreensis]|uniref:Uncharacterized protein n=1 Tax=Albula goreensis TaxID=1534307 RepID=A0A8T3D4G0_9TELE|nr:hypothetical protein AGOR_G00133880 [Albula goreensis]